MELSRWESYLTASGYVAGPEFSLADVAAGATVSQLKILSVP